jgi:hypothetical protein
VIGCWPRSLCVAVGRCGVAPGLKFACSVASTRCRAARCSRLRELVRCHSAWLVA